MTLPFSLRDWRWIALLGGILGVFGLVLHAMGRIPVCTCGFGVWTWDAWSSKNSQMLGDPYSFSHVLHGIIFYGVLYFFRDSIPLRWRFLIAVLVEIAWEILENSPLIINRYRAATASLDYFGDSILNSVGDVLCTMAGFWLANRFSWKIMLVVFVIIELLMLFTIRDNLTLNVLMLVFPIEVIKQWQTN